MKIKILILSILTLVACSKTTTEPIKSAEIVVCDNSSFVASVSQFVLKNYGEVPQQNWFLLEYNDDHKEVCRTQYAISDILNNRITKESHKDATLCTICLRNMWSSGVIDYYAYWPRGLHAGTTTEWIIDNYFVRWSVDKIVWE